MSIQYSRPLVKRSGITGAMPTIPASLDINTFLNTDIVEGELFYNIPDNKLYISDGSGINQIVVSIGTGGGTAGLPGTLAADQNTGGRDIVVSSGDKIRSATGAALNFFSTSTISAIGATSIMLFAPTIGITASSDDITMHGKNLGFTATTSAKISADSISLTGTSVNLAATNISGTASNRLYLSTPLLEVDNAAITYGDSNCFVIKQLYTNSATTTVAHTISLAAYTNCMVSIDIQVNGIDVINNKSYSANIFGAVERFGGTAALLGTTFKSENFTFTGTCDINVASNNAIIEITSPADDIYWVLRINYLISY